MVRSRGLKFPKNIFFYTTCSNINCDISDDLPRDRSDFDIGGATVKIYLKFMVLNRLQIFNIFAVALSCGSFFKHITNSSSTLGSVLSKSISYDTILEKISS